MTEKTQARIPAGMRDILPEQMLRRQYVMQVVEEVFQIFGFDPLQTSAIEMTETLMGKYGPDAERLIYKAWYGDQPQGDFALRYDLSVPLCRVMAMYPELPRPLKRYQIAPVWRADRPQKGRYREFFQCDADIVGASSMVADAEIIILAYMLLNRLGFDEFKISFSNRKLIDGIGRYSGVPAELRAGLYRSIDKLDKIGIEGVRQELLMVGVPQDVVEPLQRIARLLLQKKLTFDGMESMMTKSKEEGGESLDPRLVSMLIDPLKDQINKALSEGVTPENLQSETRLLVFELADVLRRYYNQKVTVIPDEVVESLLDLLQITGRPTEILDRLDILMADLDEAKEGIRELREIVRILEISNVPESAYQLNISMVRGLEYYTGPIFEITVEKPRAMPSISGGGRFDNLIGMFAEKSIPAVGISFGIERIIDAMTELDMFPEKVRQTNSEVLVTLFNDELAGESMKLVNELRMNGVAASIYYDSKDRLGAQIGYASSLGIPFIAILGPDESDKGMVTIRKLGKDKEGSEEKCVSNDAVIETIRNW